MTRSNVRRGALSAVAAAGAIALGLGVAAPASATLNDDGSITVDLLNITDFHGALRAAPNLAAQIAAIEAVNEDTLFSSAGDSIGGSTFESGIFQDEPTLEILNAMDLDVSAVGNHEFDQGFDDLVDRVLPIADFDYLAANVEGQSDLPATSILTTANGVRVAYIGTVTQQTPDIVSGSGVAGLTFTDPVAVTNSIAAQIRQDDAADVIVALSHESTGIVAEGFSTDVDVAFTGHSHESRAITTGNGVAVVQAGSSGGFLGRVQVTVADDGAVTVSPGTNAAVTQISQADADGDGPVATPATAPAILQLVRDAFDDARPVGAEVVGTLDEPFLAPSQNGQPSSGTPQHRGAESPLSNLIAEVAYETANEDGIAADFGIINPGGIRADLVPDAEGQVTLRQAYNVTSFSNLIGTLDLTGAQVDTMLEQQFIGQGSRPVLALGLSPQLTYVYDPTAAIGSRVTSVFLDGDAIDPDAIYTVASNVFLLEGQDGFTVFDEGTNPQALSSGLIDWEATAEFLQRPENQLLAPRYVQQSIGVTPVTPLDATYAPGDELTIDLSSLSFTGTEPKATEVVATVSPETGAAGDVTLDWSYADAVPLAAPGTVLAETAIDNTISCTPPAGATVCEPDETSGLILGNDNETGQATVTVTIPEDTVDGPFTVRYAIAPTAQLTEWVDVTVAVAADDVPPSVEPSIPPSETPPSASPSTPPAAGGGQGSLPQTGAELAGPALALAALLLLVGTGLVLRRRRTA